MTLDEAIKHAEEVADEKKKEACNLYDAKNYEESRECIWCADEYRQLAEWLKELKVYRSVLSTEDCISRESARDLMYHKQEPLNEYDLDSLPPIYTETNKIRRCLETVENTDKLEKENE